MRKIKLKVDSDYDEIYFFTDYTGFEAEFTKKEVKWINKIMEEYDKVQDLFREKYKEFKGD